MLWRTGFDKGWAISFAAVCIQRKLRDKKDLSADSGKIQICLSILVLENAKLEHLFYHTVRCRAGI